MRSENEVRTFYKQSLARTLGRHRRPAEHPALWSLATLFALWKHQSAYKPDKFLGSK